MKSLSGRFKSGASVFFTIIIIIIAVGVLLAITSQFFYLFERVDEQEVGVKLSSGRIEEVVGPGVYSDIGLYVDLRKVSSQAIPFSVIDEEIITKDKQRIGLVVSGDIFRPTLAQRDILRELWPQYRRLYLEDDLAQTRVQDLTKQAMKVCVGDRTFDDNIIGTARDELRACVDDELNKLAFKLGGLRVENVVVPEVILSPEVQVALDAIVQSRLETEKAAQDKLRANAQAGAEQARQEGEIRIEQSRFQEQAKQEEVLAELERAKIAAQRAVIEAERANEEARIQAERAVIAAQKSNDLFAAEQDLAINQALVLAATEKAKANLAPQQALADLYATYPGFLELQKIQANADALQTTDKIIFTPEGTIPNLVIPGPGIVPTVNTVPTVQSPPTVIPPAERGQGESEREGEAGSQ